MYSLVKLFFISVLFALGGLTPFAGLAWGADFFVAPDGSDDAGGDGSAANPWATIGHGLGEIPDGATLIVRPGLYEGRVRLDHVFAEGVTVRSEIPYQARLRHTGTVVTCYYGQGITFEGFDVAHSSPGASALVMQISDLIGDSGGDDYVSRITIRGNVLHDSYNNDILKINNGCGGIMVEGNIFYNQAGRDEHIDANSVIDVVIQDNVFLNDFAGSGREIGDTSCFIVIKDSNGDNDGRLGSERVTVRRNVFLHYEGTISQGYIRAGEDGTANYEAKDVLIENNLLIGNNTMTIRSPFQMWGVQNVVVRNNTVVGDMPAKEFGVRMGAYGDNPNNDGIHLHNNIWSDPTGTMGDTFNRGRATDNLTFDNNLFWNDGNSFPSGDEYNIRVEDDEHGVIGNPLLGEQADLILPRWISASNMFADGSATIRQVFVNLVTLYGTPGDGSPAIDAADPTWASEEDILGRSRDGGLAPDIGAVERESSPVQSLPGVGNVKAMFGR